MSIVSALNSLLPVCVCASLLYLNNNYLKIDLFLLGVSYKYLHHGQNIAEIINGTYYHNGSNEIIYDYKSRP